MMAAIMTSMTAGLSQAFQPHIGTSASSQDLHLFDMECPAPRFPTLWSVSFRWMLGLCIPLVFIAAPLGIHLRMKLWPRCGKVLRGYVQLSAAVLLTNLMLQVPAFVEDLRNLTPLEDLPKLMAGHKADATHYFLFKDVLSVTLPKLQFSCFPIGVLVILPWRQRKKREEIQLNFLYRQKKTRPSKVNEKQEAGEEDLKLLSPK